MPLRTFTSFEANFPDDAEFSENGDIKRPGGRNIAATLCELLKRQGLAVSEPEQHSFYGWAFTASREDAKIWFLLQFPGPWLLISQNRSFSLGRIFGSAGESAHRLMLQRLNQALRESAQFSQIQWFTKESFEKAKGRIHGDDGP